MILIALGANLSTTTHGAPIDTCRGVAAQLDGLLNLRVTALSYWYCSAAMPPSGQPPYVNGIARLEGTAAPAALLAALQAIEASHGRQRSIPNAARTLDLDIIDMDGLIRTAPDPVLPHPRMHLRGFVLRPLLDVSPDWWHPVLRRTARDLLEALPRQDIHRLHATHLRDGLGPIM